MDRYEGKGKVFVNGRLQAECSSVRVREISNNQPVHTFHKDLAGKSDGPNEAEITLEGAIPVAGYETSFDDALIDKAFMQVTTAHGGKRNTYDCWVDDFETSHAVNQTANYTVNLKGKRKSSSLSGALSALGL